ncbi:hypothetical protein AOG1_28500 [Geobacter sp. AOG1]|nr:hypothetical protein AOG1_28500 [Geobacter sp. AOG1]
MLNAGSQTLSVVFTPTDTVTYNSASKTVTLTVNPAAATVTLGGLTATYDGTAKSATATTNPAGKTVSFTYNGSATAPTAAGSYPVVGTITDANYTGSATGTLVIAKATPSISWATPTPVVVGTALSSTQLNATASVAGTYVYTPVSGAVMNTAGSQTLSVSFTPNDTTNYTNATASVNLTVNALVNQAPTMIAIPNATVTAPAAFSYQVAATDPENQSLAYTLSGAPAGMSISGAGFINCPTTAAGSYTITVTATDPGNLSASKSFTLTVTTSTSPAPVITSAPVTAALVDTSYSYKVSAYDPNGKSLYYSLSDHPDGMEIGGSTGLITWKPSHTGTYKVTVRVRNSSYYSTTQNFYVTVTEDAVSPTDHTLKITSTPVTTAYRGNTYVYAVRAVDSAGDPLVYSLTSAPSGMSISSAGIITWKPTSSQYGSYRVTVRVSDGSLSAYQTFYVSVRSGVTDYHYESFNQGPCYLPVRVESMQTAEKSGFAS